MLILSYPSHGFNETTYVCLFQIENKSEKYEMRTRWRTFYIPSKNKNLFSLNRIPNKLNIKALRKNQSLQKQPACLLVHKNVYDPFYYRLYCDEEILFDRGFFTEAFQR